MGTNRHLFDEQVSNLRKTIGRKLSLLGRLSKCMSIKQQRILRKAFTEKLCTLVNSHQFRCFMKLY